MINTCELISREKALEALREANVQVKGMRLGKTILAKYAEQVREGYIDILKEVPAVEVSELVPMAHWINVGKTDRGSPIRMCGWCGIKKAGRPRSNYCPDCGARMLLTMDELTDVLKSRREALAAEADQT